MPIDQNMEINQILAGVVRSFRENPIRVNSPKNVDLAQRMMRYSASGVSPWRGLDLLDSKKERPSAVSRIFDILSRPLYGTMEAIKSGMEAAEEDKGFFGGLGDVIEGIGEGVSGKEKTMFADVLEQGGMSGGWQRSALGFAGDVVLDPLNLVGVGLLSKLGIKGAQEGQKALNAVQDLTVGATREALKGISELKIPEAARPSVPRTARETGAEGTVFEKPEAAAPWSIAGFVDMVPRATPQETLPVIKLPRIERPPSVAEEALRKPTQGIPANIRNLPIEEAIPALIKSQQRVTSKIRKNRQHERVLAKADVESADTFLERMKLLGGEVITKAMPESSLNAARTERVEDIAFQFSRTHKHREYTPIAQATLWDNMVDSVDDIKLANPNASEASVNKLVFDSYVAAEKALERQGKVFIDWDGNPLKLSEVLNEIGVTERKITGADVEQIVDAFKHKDATRVTNPDIATAIETAKAKRKVATADLASRFMKEGAKRAREIQLSPNAARAKEARIGLGRALTAAQKRAGATAGDIKAQKEFLGRIFDDAETATLRGVHARANELLRQAASGKVDIKSSMALSDDVYKSLGLRTKRLATAIPAPKVVESIMSRMATWWGVDDIRPFQREAIDSARLFAAQFEKAWANTVRHSTKEQRLEAFHLAQGVGTPTSKESSDIANMFRSSMEQLFGSSRLSNEVEAGNTVALRMGLTMKEMNSELAKLGADFRFIDDAEFVDKFNVAHDFSKDADWLNSWEIADYDDPMKLIHQLYLGLQRVTRKNAMLDDAAGRWGSAIKTASFNTKVDAGRINGFWFPKEIADQMNTMLKRMDPNDWRPGTPASQFYDRALMQWKASVTIYAPSHHIRNMIGDMWLAALDGVTTLRPYTIAAKVIYSNRGRYKDVQDVLRLSDPDAVKLAMAKPGDTALTTKGGLNFTYEQIRVLMDNNGLLPRPTVLEDITAEGGKLIPDIFGGVFRRSAHAVSETRDHYVRIAHFVDALKKSKTKSLDEAVRGAAYKVRKYHPDGMDLTEFERKVFRRIIPFYSWLRKASPLMVEALVAKPALITVYPKFMANVQDLMGIESMGGMGDPFPADQQFPEWLRAKGIGPILQQGMAGIPGAIADLARGEDSYVQVNPSTPFGDIVGDFSQPREFGLSALTPALRIPAELAFDQEALGAPIDNKLEYFLKQAPPVEIATRLTGMGITPPYEERTGAGWSPEKLIRWLTASGLIGTGPYKRQAAFEIREALQNGNK